MDWMAVPRQDGGRRPDNWVGMGRRLRLERRSRAWNHLWRRMGLCFQFQCDRGSGIWDKSDDALCSAQTKDAPTNLYR